MAIEINNNDLVVPSLSSSGLVFSQNGNSNQWNQAYNVATAYQSASSNWQDTYSFIQTNSAELIPAIEENPIDTDLDTFSKSIVLGGTSFTQIPSFKTSYINPIDFSVETVSFTGVGHRGSFTLTSPIRFKNNFISYNIDFFDGSITIVSIVNLINFSMPKLKGAMKDIYVFPSNNLSSLNFSNLEYIGGYLNIGSSSFPENLQEINFPKLKTVIGTSNNSITIGGYGSTKAPIISAIHLPNLKYVIGGYIVIGGSTSSGNANFRPFSNLRTLNLSSLEFSPTISIVNAPALTSLSFESLKILKGGANFPSCTALKDVFFPNLEYIGGYISTITSSMTNSLTGIFMPNLKIYNLIFNPTDWTTSASIRELEIGTNTLKEVNSTSFSVNQTLTQQSVDNILKAFANLDGTNNTVEYGAGNTLSFAGSNSAPSYTGGITTTSSGTNFVRTGTTVVASVVGHGHTTGDIVTFTGNGQAALNGTYIITVNTPDQFQYITTTSGNITGSLTVTMRRTTVATDGFRYFQTIALRGVTITINQP